MQFIGKCLMFCIRCYQLTISPLMGNCCRFHPSCSTYAIEAIKTHGPFIGVWLGILRILRCNPWGSWGSDPVPRKLDGNQSQLPSD